MVELIKVGPDELNEWDLNEVKDDARFEWFIYWYEEDGYDGSGYALALNKEDGLLYYKNLSHCSYYGPMEGWATGSDKLTVEEFFKEPDSIFDYDIKEEVKLKAMELLPRPKTPVFDEKFNFLEKM